MLCSLFFSCPCSESVHDFSLQRRQGKDKDMKPPPRSLITANPSYRHLEVVIAIDPQAIEVYHVEKVPPTSCWSRTSTTSTTSQRCPRRHQDLSGPHRPGLSGQLGPHRRLQDAHRRSALSRRHGRHATARTPSSSRVDGWRIAHLGDLGHELTTRQFILSARSTSS